MEKIISFLAITLTDMTVQEKPLCHGFTIKLSPPLNKDNVVPKTFDELFTKIDHEVSEEPTRKFVTKVDTQTDVTGTKPIKVKEIEFLRGTESGNFINVPIIPQPFPDYKIIVATAPWNVRIDGDEAKPAVIYIVFPEDDSVSKSLNIPAIYFIRNPEGTLNLDGLLKKKDKIDPVIIVDSNRTVTGLRSSNIIKYIKFKSKLSKNTEFETPIHVIPLP